MERKIDVSANRRQCPHCGSITPWRIPRTPAQRGAAVISERLEQMRLTQKVYRNFR